MDYQRAYRLAREQFAEWSIDTERALETLDQIPLSLHCWQGDDVAGFEASGQPIGGGLAVTGNYPGRARNPDELRRDLRLALRLIPGPTRLNLHASYAESTGRLPERDALGFDQFRNWVDWANEHGLGLDFNPTYFAHPLAADGWTLSHLDPGIRRFWIHHGIACRRIAAAIGAACGSPCVNNLWIPDGSKDQVIDRRAPRERLAESLDQIFAESLPAESLIDAVECKLFGLGSESYVVGSHEFYLGYALTRRKWLCLDAGHFHPTESIADKVSSVLQFVDGLLLHVSRGVRWDSDHVVIATDDLRAIALELVRNSYLDRVRIGLDYFDASINRIAAWVIGARAARKALLSALLEPTDRLRRFESDGDFTSRLALLEEAQSLPVGAVWDYYCERVGVPVGRAWLDEVREYERTELLPRVAVDRALPGDAARLGFTLSKSGPPS
ncbi:MAG: L-rhamnose isomerase [Planctomycetes bacterium]|nr:L-rhamnose isomerase [Planctomycetota bacterium]